MTEQIKVPRRKKLGGQRRVMVGAAVRPELADALAEGAAERNQSVSAFAADVLAEKMGVPA